jgi:hypothetical protein
VDSRIQRHFNVMENHRGRNTTRYYLYLQILFILSLYIQGVYDGVGMFQPDQIESMDACEESALFELCLRLHLGKTFR